MTAAPQQMIQPHTVTSCLQPLTPIDCHPDIETGEINPEFSQKMGEPGVAGPSFQPQSVAITKARALKSLNRPVAKAVRKSRTCRKCAIEGCAGRKEVKHCTNMCWDCGWVNFLETNSKRPTK